MHLHEYQAKQILERYHIPVPAFGVASSPEEAVAIASKLGLTQAVIKIQVHAGGRGKAGGVKFAKTPEDIRLLAEKLIGLHMINQQTGPAGITAYQVLISSPLDIAQEYYLAALIDRKRGRPVLIASQAGGMDIEEVPEDQILVLPFELTGHIHPYQLRKFVQWMGWEGDLAKRGTHLAQQLCLCFMQQDAALIEINPLVRTPEGLLIALDAKMSLDDNALFRHKELAAWFDPLQISPQEAAAKEYDLAYIAMDGEIGCMVNGAGLAMATMDIIQLYGSSPANFLDVGGSATRERVAAGFRIILSDPKVKAILVNIFGGIMNCATIAEGVIAAAKELTKPVPIIVRLEGTNVKEGRRLFAESGLAITSAHDLADAAEKSVQAARG